MATTLAVLGSLAAVAGGSLAVNHYMEVKAEERRKAKKKKKKKGTGNGKNGSKVATYAENAALGNSPDIVKQVVPPIELGDLGPVSIRMPKTGNVVTYKQLTIRTNEVLGDGKKLALTPAQAIAGLVTNMGAATTKLAWETLKQHVKIDGGVTFDAPSESMDNAIAQVLATVDTGTDWSQGLSPHTANSREAKLWQGATMLGELMYQSIWNQYAESEDEPIDGGNGGGAQQGSTTGNAEIQSQWDNWYAKGDLKGLIKIVRQSQLGPTGKNFTAEIKVFEDDMTRDNGNYTGVGNFDSPTDDGLIVLYGKDPADVQARVIKALNAKEASL